MNVGDRVKVVVDYYSTSPTPQLKVGAIGTVTGIVDGFNIHTGAKDKVASVKLDGFNNPLFDVEPYGWGYPVDCLELIV